MNMQSKLVAESTVIADCVKYTMDHSSMAASDRGSVPGLRVADEDGAESNDCGPRRASQAHSSMEDSEPGLGDYFQHSPCFGEGKGSANAGGIGTRRPPMTPIVGEFLRNLKEEIGLLSIVKNQLEEAISRNVSQGLRMSLHLGPEGTGENKPTKSDSSSVKVGSGSVGDNY
jgi:hypothetical protein